MENGEEEEEEDEGSENRFGDLGEVVERGIRFEERRQT